MVDQDTSCNVVRQNVCARGEVRSRRSTSGRALLLTADIHGVADYHLRPDDAVDLNSWQRVVADRCRLRSRGHRVGIRIWRSNKGNSGCDCGLDTSRLIERLDSVLDSDKVIPRKKTLVIKQRLPNPT